MEERDDDNDNIAVAEARPSALEQMASRHRVAAERERAAFEGALRVAFGRMAADCPGLDGAVQQVRQQQASLAEVIEQAEPGMFLALLEGQQDRMGLVMICPTVLAGMIEAQTTGLVNKAPPPRRKPTRTDAALLAPMIEAFLRLIEARCAELPQAGLVSGFTYGSFLADPRPLGLMLDDERYMILRLQVSLGAGAKAGAWLLVLPVAKSARAGESAEKDATAAAHDWDARLEATVNNSPVQLEAVLCRVQMSLTEALRLRPGDLLRLPDSALESLALESIAHEALGIGRLGQARGQRAVRLTAEPGILTDATGVSVSPVALPASVLPFRPPKAAFVPDGQEEHRQQAAQSDDDAAGEVSQGNSKGE